jgi:hypothetical protein
MSKLQEPAPPVPPATTRIGVRVPWRILIPALVLVAVAALFILLEIRSPAPDIFKASNLGTLQEKALETVLDLTKLFMTWSLGIIGAMAYFLKTAFEGKAALKRGRLIAAELVVLSSAFSLFFGHLVFNSVLNMLALGFFNLQDSSLVTSSVAQYATFLASVILFGLYIHFTYWPLAEKVRENPDPAPQAEGKKESL